MMEGRIGEIEGLAASAEPFRKFMASQVHEGDLALFLDLAGLPPAPENARLPFLVIDMVVASLLMSLGMMMLPPNAVSLPFKLIFFVLIDAGGWSPAAWCRALPVDDRASGTSRSCATRARSPADVPPCTGCPRAAWQPIRHAAKTRSVRCITLSPGKAPSLARCRSTA
jgi:hypothetical protein